MRTAILESIPAAKKKAHPDYLALVEKFPPRAITTEADYDATAAVMEKLAIFEPTALSKGEQQYLDLLTDLIERYDDAHYSTALSVTPIETLTALMEHREMTPADLAKIVGSQPEASMILSGARKISKTQAKKLAKHFRVDAGLFI